MDRDHKKFDFILLGAVCILCLFGMVLIASATKLPVKGFKNAPTFYMQIFWFLSGLIIMVLAAFINYPFISKFYIPIYILNLILLVLVLVMKRVTGASVLREIRIGSVGSSVGIMPSEFSKIFMIIFLSTVITKHRKRINHPLVLFPILCSGAIPVVLILLQPSMSAAVVMMVLTVILIFIGGLSYKYIVAAVAIFIPLAGFFYYDINREEHILVHKIFEPYQLEKRIKPFFNPDEKGKVDQTEAGVFAIGSGGIKGQGLFQNKFPIYEAQNDFIFSVLGAEFGFIGAMFALALMFIVIVRCLYIAMKANNLLGRLIAAGAGSLLAFQVFVNVGVNINLLPNTGMAFPFLSAGGSAMWVNLALIGLVLNVGMERSQSMFEDLD